MVQRIETAFEVRVNAATSARAQSATLHQDNGDETLYESKIASYSKCLKHDELGEVDLTAYADLMSAIDNCDARSLLELPLEGTLRLASPLGGFAFSMQGADSAAIALEPPPTFASSDTAYEMCELYWMALVGDIPFDEHAASPLVQQARDDLGRWGPAVAVAGGADRLFSNFAGLTTGPHVSQFLLRDYQLDGMVVNQKMLMPSRVDSADGLAFLTEFQEWRVGQEAFPPPHEIGTPNLETTPRYVRSLRDLGWFVDQSSITPTYQKAAFMLMELGRAALNSAHPYKTSSGVGGLATFDAAHLLNLLGYVSTCHHVNFLKWRHRRLRPEAMAARVHNTITGAKQYPIHPLLLDSSVLPLIRHFNEKMNQRRNFGTNKATYLLPMVAGEGSPTHPSYPAGHSCAAAIGVTLLKAWFDEDFILPDTFTMKISNDGHMLKPYLAGIDGPPLTIGGELNKLANNVSMGRCASGLHFRSDCVAGNLLGEELAIRLLREQKSTYAEDFPGFGWTRFFDGPVVA